jgi:RNA polymerase sigma-70 factor (sigma-E family)
VTQINADDATSFELFIHARGPEMSRTAALLMGDIQLGEDLTQEVLAAVGLRWARLRQLDALDAYVHRCLINRSVSWRRRRSWRSEIAVADVPERAGVESTPDVDHGDLLRALRLLPPRQRTAVVLRFYWDWSEAQTADHMGCSVGTVKSQTAKALKKLREQLDEASEPMAPTRRT